MMTITQEQYEMLADPYISDPDAVEYLEGTPTYATLIQPNQEIMEDGGEGAAVISGNVEANSVGSIEDNIRRIWGIETYDIPSVGNVDVDKILSAGDAGDGTVDPTMPTDKSGKPITSLEGYDVPIDPKAIELQRIINRDPGSKVSIEYDEEGNKKSVTIVGSGNNTEFQGLGKYGSPEEFMEKNPEGFRLTNPGLWKKMQEEQAAQAAQQFSTPKAQMTLDQLKERYTQINEIKDFKERAVAIAQLEGDVAKAKVGFIQSAEQQARVQLGIDKLTQELQASMKRDKLHPMYIQSGGKPSIETTAIAQQLKLAEKAYSGTVKQLLASNPLLGELEQGSKYLTRLAERDLDRDMRRAETAEEKKILTEEKRKAEIENFSAALGSKKELVALMWPDIGADMAAVKTRLEFETKKDTKKAREFSDALEAGENGAFKLALRGNEFATEIAIGKAARDKGISREEARRQMYPYANIVASTEAARDAANEMGLLDKKQSNAKTKDPLVTLAEYATNPDLMKNAGLKDEAIQARIRLAERYADFKVGKTFGEDVRSWSVKSQAMQQYLSDPTKSNGKPISINTIIDDIRTRPMKDRIPLFRDLRQAFEASAEAANKASAYGQMNITKARDVLEARMAMTSFFEDLGEGLSIWR